VSVLRSRFRGVLLGLAAGEALGAPAEFLSAEQIAGRYGVITDMLGGGCHEVAPGETTDATDMALALAESLIEVGEFDPEDVMEHYRRWFETGPRDVSLTVRTVMLSYRAGTPWDLASRRGYEILGRPVASNGSLMRCAPLALRYVNQPEERRLATRRESTLTHFDRLAGWACVAFNDLVVGALHDRLQAEITAVAERLADEDNSVSAALFDAQLAEPEEIECSAFVLDSLKAALWAVLHTTTFEEAVCFIVNKGNDADTVAAITGALAGAVYGEEGIPARWRSALLNYERVIAAADGLAALVGGG
jgi:ADP-ribosyl-[dinitrogen reductase] hydrolase